MQTEVWAVGVFGQTRASIKGRATQSATSGVCNGLPDALVFETGRPVLPTIHPRPSSHTIHMLHFNFGHIGALPVRRVGLRSSSPASDAQTSTDATADAPTDIDNGVSAFGLAQAVPPDPILSIRDAFLKDPTPGKVNLSVGVYRTDEGQPLVLDCVQEAEDMMLAEQLAGKANKEYLPPLGLQDFCTRSLKVLLGDAIQPALEAGRVVTTQSLSGTGGLHLAARLLAQIMPGTTVHLPSPTWPIHPDIFLETGLRVAYYPYYNAATRTLDFDLMLATLRSLPAGSAVLFHACAHNPTGCDPTKDQWRRIAEAVAHRGLLPIVDSAYQGLASGDLDEDGYGARCLLGIPNAELITIQSFSKNMGLYAERAGVMTVVCRDADVAGRVGETLGRIVRLSYSSPAQHGSRIVHTILSDPARLSAWKAELKLMAERLLEMRRAFSAALSRAQCPPPQRPWTPGRSPAHLEVMPEVAGCTSDGTTPWPHVLSQRGMFTYSGLTAEHAEALRARHHVYLPSDGRICMAALTHETCDRVAAAIKDVLERGTDNATAAADETLPIKRTRVA